MSQPPSVDEEKVSLFTIAMQLAVLTEKVKTLEKRGSNTWGISAVIIAGAVAIINLAGKVNWA